MSSKAQTALRIEVQMLKRAELLVPHLAKDPLMRAIGTLVSPRVVGGKAGKEPDEDDMGRGFHLVLEEVVPSKT